MARATDAEKKLRIQTIYEMVLKGATRPPIIRYARKAWNIGSRQVDTYLAIVDKQIEETFGEKDKEKMLTKVVAQLSDLYVKNYTIRDFRECRNILELLSKLVGLNAPKSITLSNDPNNPINLNPVMSKEQFEILLDEARKNKITSNKGK